MRELFLGKPWHWLLAVVCIALLAWAGETKLHVIHFNAFVIALLIGGLAVVLLLVYTTKPGDRVTRDPLEESDDGA